MWGQNPFSDGMDEKDDSAINSDGKEPQPQ